MNNPNNKSKIAIVVVGYNRLASIKRLLQSLLDAKYPKKDIPLVISIDCSGDEQLYKYVKDFRWPYGDRYIRIQETRLGLKKHIIECGNLTKYFKAIILLEDDLFVSPYFYDYIEQTVEKYGDDERIAEISLYKNERNGYVGLPFDNMKDGSDVFLMQDVGTWGECWTEQMWNGFSKWYNEECSEEIILATNMPSTIKTWTKAWSKYYNAYVVSKNKYILYPNIAVCTNFNDAGEHVNNSTSDVQVSLLMNTFPYKLPDFESLIKYDVFFNNENIYDWIGLKQDELCIDLYGFQYSYNNKDYLLSTKILSCPIRKSFGIKLRPIELNVKYDIKGTGIFLYDIHNKQDVEKGHYPFELISYFLKGFNIILLLQKVWAHKYILVKYYIRKILRK